MDQAHRGYNVSTHATGYASVNPLFMKYEPSDGRFSGQSGYGYKSIAEFVRAAREINAGKREVRIMCAVWACLRDGPDRSMSLFDSSFLIGP